MEKVEVRAQLESRLAALKEEIGPRAMFSGFITAKEAAEMVYLKETLWRLGEPEEPDYGDSERTVDEDGYPLDDMEN